MKNRTTNYIATIPMKNVEQVYEVKKTLEQIFGWVVLRGRHSDRKKVLGDMWYKFTQNDIPWRKAQYIDIYLHPKNPNYESVNKGKGIKRLNLDKVNDTPRLYGSLKMGFYDGYINTLTEKAKNDPKLKRKLDKEKYHNTNRKLRAGEWGYITQSILDFVEKHNVVTFTEMKEYYDVILRGNIRMMNGGSFSHHLQALRNPKNAKRRRCNRLLYKDTTGKYRVKIEK
jgi:hypothetical protein